MWYESESTVMPLEVDNTSSSVYVYVRKDIEEVTDEEKGTYYTYKEQKIKKEDWEFYKTLNEVEFQTLQNTIDCELLYALLGEEME